MKWNYFWISAITGSECHHCSPSKAPRPQRNRKKIESLFSQEGTHDNAATLCAIISDTTSPSYNREFTSKERRAQGNVCACFQALRDWVAIESDSSNVLKRPELHRMMEMVAQKLRQMGGTVELVDIGEQEVSDGAHLWWNATKKTYEKFFFLLTAQSFELLKEILLFKQRTEPNSSLKPNWL